jgi:hypothetical protein
VAGLLQSIKGLLQLSDGAVVLLKTWGFLHIDLFLSQLTIQVGTIEVEGVYVPVISHSNHEDDPNASYFCDR